MAVVSIFLVITSIHFLQVKGISDSTKKQEEVLGDVPDEFLGISLREEICRLIAHHRRPPLVDPIVFTLMSDPVLLPSSKQIVDRTVIL